MPEKEPKDNLALTSEELEAQDAAPLPNREAMSVISPSPIPISMGPGDVQTMPVSDGGQGTAVFPSQSELSGTATDTANTATTADPPEQSDTYSPHETSVAES